ncbi:hypothetical protein GXW73_34445, partial [Roseomonas hellenica]|nr:hypothetical protein [Plastoroseomonas hellenica]
QTLPDPAPTPPAPAVLDPRPAPSNSARGTPTAPPSLPAGVEALPEGGIRIQGATFDGALRQAVVEYGRSLAATPNGRVTVLAEVVGPTPPDPHTARRASLARALAVKAALVEGGLPPTRIDLRPLGRTEAGTDRLDVLPPGVTRSDSAR